MQQLIEVTQGDQLYNLDFALEDDNGNPVDISGASVFFRCQLKSNPQVKFKNAMVILDGANGLCYYQVGASDFLIADDYTAQVVVQYGSGKIITFDDILVQVTAKIFYPSSSVSPSVSTSPSKSPSLSPSLSPSASPSVSPSA